MATAAAVIGTSSTDEKIQSAQVRWRLHVESQGNQEEKKVSVSTSTTTMTGDLERNGYLGMKAKAGMFDHRSSSLSHAQLILGVPREKALMNQANTLQHRGGK